MLAYRKWVLSLGIAAVTPGITLAGPFSLFKSDQTSQAAADSQKVAEEVAARLRAEKLSGFDMDIEVIDGTCRLSGRIADAQQKQTATAVASKVPGVRKVDNQLSVLNESPATSPAGRGSGGAIQQTGFLSRKSGGNASGGEQQVANDIASAIGHSGMRGHDINVTFRGGVATLSGRVASPQDVAAMTRLVSQVRGVQQVDNQLMAPGMRPAGPPAGSNQAVAEHIAQALAANQLGGENIEVRFNGGTATLNGSVGHPQMKAYAEYIASSVPGVGTVSNNLQVTGMPAGPQGAGPIQQVGYQQQGGPMMGPGGPMMGPGGPMMAQGGPMMGPGGQMMAPGMHPMMAHGGHGGSHMAYDQPNLPAHSWPTYAAYPNSAAVSYPTEYSASAWPYIGPFYPYPQVPLGWRQVQLEWDDGNWNLNFRPRTDRMFWFFDPKNW